MTELNAILQAFAVILLLLALTISLLAMIRFTSVLIKCVALEVIANLFVGAISLWSLFTAQIYFFDVCLAVTLVMFLATVAYCQFLSTRV